MRLDEDSSRDQHRYVLTIERAERLKVTLSPADELLLAECTGRPDATISDTLLALELLARRIEESSS